MPASLLLDDLAAFAPHAVAVTGDLVNFALPAEFIAARDILHRIGPPGRVSVIPGNHDALVPVPWAQGIGQWAEWMRDDDAGEGFPFVHRRGPAALVGLSTAIPTPPGWAAGRLGAAQLGLLGQRLAALREEGLFRVVLIHHPPCGENRRRGLRDRAALLDVLAREGAELLLHGHSHRPGLVPLPGPGGSPVPAIGVPPALAGAGRHHLSRWHLHRVTPSAGGWWLETLVRGYDPQAQRFATLGEWRLRVAAPVSTAV
ncbi:MAG: hypothetical protein JWP20_913 [Roseomonas sp.]|nr:hypothetical protein [Roseomonas sp.]